MPPPGYVYILTNRRAGTLFVGSTGNLAARVAEHRAGTIPGFTARYRVRRLVHVEAYADIRDAVVRERRLKKWRREWKLALVEGLNPDWADLWPSLTGRSGVARCEWMGPFNESLPAEERSTADGQPP